MVNKKLRAIRKAQRESIELEYTAIRRYKYHRANRIPFEQVFIDLVNPKPDAYVCPWDWCDNDGSFHIFPDGLNCYHCFSCGQYGKPVEFVAEYLCIDLAVAAEYLLYNYGELVMASKRSIIPIGATFGKWTVLREVGKNKHGSPLYECECECGFIKEIVSGALKDGGTKQCKRCYVRSRRNFVNNSCS